MPTDDEATQLSAEELAKRLNLLLDVATAEGHTSTFREISEALDANGVHVSRARWSYMTAGSGPAVKDVRLLTALAEFFGVSSDFLTQSGTSEVPERVEAQLELVTAMRKARVKSFATRTLGDVSPETLRAITRFLEDDAVDGVGRDESQDDEK